MATADTIYAEDLVAATPCDPLDAVPPTADPERLRLRDSLINDYLPLANKIAYKKQRDMPRCVQLDELKSAAYVGLLDAASRFDPSKHTIFAVYARIRIIGAINDYLRGRTWGGRTRKAYAWSLDVEVQTGRSGHAVSLEDAVASRKSMESMDSDDFFRHVCKSLPVHVQDMFKMYYRDELTMKVIGKRYGISEARVSQLLTEYKDFLRKELDQEKEDLFREARPRQQGDGFRLQSVFQD